MAVRAREALLWGRPTEIPERLFLREARPPAVSGERGQAWTEPTGGLLDSVRANTVVSEASAVAVEEGLLWLRGSSPPPPPPGSWPNPTPSVVGHHLPWAARPSGGSASVTCLSVRAPRAWSSRVSSCPSSWCCFSPGRRCPPLPVGLLPRSPLCCQTRCPQSPPRWVAWKVEGRGPTGGPHSRLGRHPDVRSPTSRYPEFCAPHQRCTWPSCGHRSHAAPAPHPGCVRTRTLRAAAATPSRHVLMSLLVLESGDDPSFPLVLALCGVVLCGVVLCGVVLCGAVVLCRGRGPCATGAAPAPLRSPHHASSCRSALAPPVHQALWKDRSQLGPGQANLPRGTPLSLEAGVP